MGKPEGEPSDGITMEGVVGNYVEDEKVTTFTLVSETEGGATHTANLLKSNIHPDDLAKMEKGAKVVWTYGSVVIDGAKQRFSQIRVVEDEPDSVA